jgi:hypothetical protein
VTRSGISEETRARVRDQAGHRCGYCLAPQRLVLGWLEVEHIIPQAQGGSDDEDNLWLACRLCNNYKSDQVEGLDPQTGQRVRLFDPRRRGGKEPADLLAGRRRACHNAGRRRPAPFPVKETAHESRPSPGSVL